MKNKKLTKKVANSGILPNEQQKLLLKACLLEGGQVISNFEQWFASYSFPKYSNADSNIGLPPMYDQLDGGSQRLLSLLYKNQSKVGNDHPVIKMLQGYYKYVWYRNQILKKQYQQINKALLEQNIQSIVFKGIALSEKYYGDYGSRPTSDIDLLVKKEEWEEAVSVLESMGWVSRFGNPIDLPKSLRSAHTFQNGELELDLHCNISHYDLSNQTKQVLWKNAQTDVNGFQFLPISIELLLTFLHGLQSNVIPPIRWVADSVMILKRFTKPDWKAFISLIEKEECAFMVLVALNYLSDHEFAEIPIDLISRIEQLKTSKINHRYFSLIGMRKNPNDFKSGLFSLYKILKSNERKPINFLSVATAHYKYMWGVENIGQLLIVLMRRLIDKVLYPKRQFKPEINREKNENSEIIV